jgi:redox-sensitive bicupin YhaK (pirin superfamily)
MSWQDCTPPESHVTTSSADPVEMVVVPRTSDLGGFEVRRALPFRDRRMVGPFIFFDAFGPTIFQPGNGLDVRPHPHIGLATVTYLYDGEIRHRDSLGTVQNILPGEVNWMTAGRGIAHSERTPSALRTRQTSLAGIQTWVALPQGMEETDPGFTHHPRETLPIISEHGLTVRVIAGALFGETSPVPTFSKTIYADAALDSGTTLPLDTSDDERALYVTRGGIEIGGQLHGQNEMLILRPGDALSVKARTDSRVLLLGGEPMDGPRYIWWNFVSSRKERIEQATTEWNAGRFATVPEDSESIPAPDVPRLK